MDEVQRHNMTCPYCGVLTEHGFALDDHLRSKHGIADRDVLYRIYRHQVTTAPGRELAETEPLPVLDTGDSPASPPVPASDVACSDDTGGGV